MWGWYIKVYNKTIKCMSILVIVNHFSYICKWHVGNEFDRNYILTDFISYYKLYTNKTLKWIEYKYLFCHILCTVLACLCINNVKEIQTVEELSKQWVKFNYNNS